MKAAAACLFVLAAFAAGTGEEDALLPRPPGQRQWRDWPGERPLGWRAVSTSEVLSPTERKHGVYVFAGDGVTIPEGFRTDWITPKP